MTTQDTTMHNVMCGPGGPVWEPVVPLALSLQLPPHTASGTPPGAQAIFHQSGFIFVNNLIKKSYLYFLLILSVLFLKLSISSCFSIFCEFPILLYVHFLFYLTSLNYNDGDHIHAHTIFMSIFSSMAMTMQRDPDYENTLQYSSSPIILVFLCIFKPLIHLDTPFVYGMGLGSHFIFLQVAVRLIQYTY